MIGLFDRKYHFRVQPAMPSFGFPVTLEHVTRLDVPVDSIFWTGWVDGSLIRLYGRKQYNVYAISSAVAHASNFSVINSSDPYIIAEDPRLFEFRGEQLLIDNRLHKVRVIPLSNVRYIPVHLKGKNFVWYEENEELRFMWKIKPVTLYKFNLEKGSLEPVPYPYDPGAQNHEYRGGTPLFKMNSSFQFGFGHRTIVIEKRPRDKNRQVFHNPFIIVKNESQFMVLPMEKPQRAMKISDPSAILLINGVFYLIMAESKKEWFFPQQYDNHVYRIHFGTDQIPNITQPFNCSQQSPEEKEPTESPHGSNVPLPVVNLKRNPKGRDVRRKQIPLSDRIQEQEDGVLNRRRRNLALMLRRRDINRRAFF
jgi:hypothetical protein